MKKTLWLLAFGGLYIACNSGPTPEAEAPTNNNILPYEIHQHQLENGVNVVTVPYESPGLASFYIVVRVGSREEVESGKTGFAHFFEHMMFRGTDKYPKERYNDVLQSTGAAANANTWLDRTLYHMTGNASMLDQMFEIEADRFQNLNYSVADFKVEAGAVKGEYTKNFASQFVQINEAIVKEAFDKHTYQHTTMGFFDDIVDMPNQYDYSLEFYDRFYRPEYATIIVVGDVEPQKVNELAQKYFGMWKRGNYKANIEKEPVQTETRYTHIQNEGFIPFVGLNYKSPAFSDKTTDFATMDLIASILFSERSDLYKKLVVDEQKALNIFGYIFGTRDPFLFQVGAMAKDENDLQYLKDEIVAAMNKLKTEPIDPKLLTDTKSNQKYSFAMGIDEPGSIAESLSYFVWLTGDPESINNYYRALDSVTPEDIMKCAQKYFVESGLTIATISSKAEGGIQ